MELKKLHGEIAMLTSEREVLVKASQKAELLKQRVESLRSVETQLSALQEEVRELIGYHVEPVAKAETGEFQDSGSR